MVIDILKLVSVLVAAVMVGNWFMSELKNCRRENKPWYAVYLTIPGILIIVAICVLPVLAWFVKQQ